MAGDTPPSERSHLLAVARPSERGRAWCVVHGAAMQQSVSVRCCRASSERLVKNCRQISLCSRSCRSWPLSRFDQSMGTARNEEHYSPARRRLTAQDRIPRTHAPNVMPTTLRALQCTERASARRNVRPRPSHASCTNCGNSLAFVGIHLSRPLSLVARRLSPGPRPQDGGASHVLTRDSHATDQRAGASQAARYAEQSARRGLGCSAAKAFLSAVDVLASDYGLRAAGKVGRA